MNGKRLSLELRSEIAALYSTKTMSMQDLANKYNVSKSTIHHIVKKKALYGSVADRPKSGRPKISTDRDNRTLSRMSMANRCLTLAQLRMKWNIQASKTTVRNRLRAAGIRGYIARRKPMLTATHRKCRLRWCRDRRGWSVDAWRNIIFSDESSFCLIPNSYRVSIHRRRDEAYRPECLAPSYKTRSPTVMVWGVINGNGTGPLVRCIGRINQHAYKDTLEAHVAYLQSGTFMQDNAPCHSTHLIRNWFEQQGITTLPWPSLSPDLNPLEHLWGIMKRKIQGEQFHDKNELWMKLQEIWSSFTPEFVQRYVDSMPQRIRAVIKAKGGAIHY
jgi:transposase